MKMLQDTALWNSSVLVFSKGRIQLRDLIIKAIKIFYVAKGKERKLQRQDRVA